MTPLGDPVFRPPKWRQDARHLVNQPKFEFKVNAMKLNNCLLLLAFLRVFSEKGVKHSFSSKNGLTSCVVSPYLEHLILTKLSQYVCGINELG